MEIKENIDQHLFDEFVNTQKRSQFLQSFAWGQCQSALGMGIRRFASFEKSQPVAAVQVLVHNLPVGRKYWYLPRGPVVSGVEGGRDWLSAFLQLFKHLISAAKKDDVMFLRFEPPFKAGHINFNSIIDLPVGWSGSVQPKDTLYLDLKKTEDELLEEMHPKTRYNIRLAEKKGVTVRLGTVDDRRHFHRLNAETTARDDFRAHPPSYYDNLFRSLPPGFIKLYLAEFDGQVTAANIVVVFGDTTTYLHGVSSNDNRNLMSPHFLQWRQIAEAKKQGSKYYDFWGIAPSDQPEHRWAGLTRFKKSFGGEPVSYYGASDLILNRSWDNLYSLAKKFL